MYIKDLYIETNNTDEVRDIWELFLNDNIFSESFENVVGIYDKQHNGRYEFHVLSKENLITLIRDCKAKGYNHASAKQAIFDLAINQAYDKLLSSVPDLISLVLEVIQYDSTSGRYVCDLYVLPKGVTI